MNALAVLVVWLLFLFGGAIPFAFLWAAAFSLDSVTTGLVVWAALSFWLARRLLGCRCRS